MAKIAYILLCHKDPDSIIAQATRLTAAGDFVSIHFDGRAPRADFHRLRTALDANRSVTFAERRVKCGWGEWSLVEATLQAVRAALQTFPGATHLYMLSGDCMPIKSARHIQAFLDADDADYIESFDFFTSGWIKTGPRDERLVYRHYFNERRQKRLFYASMAAQKWWGLLRAVPKDLSIRIGSQWWCLRRRTVEQVLEFAQTRRDVMRFFRTTWIPDETFFQTLVPHLVAAREIRVRTLSFLMFTDYGLPLTFYNDHYDLLVSQDYLFARKISGDADRLKLRLGELYASDQNAAPISDEGRKLFHFLTGRGRHGQRFGTRIWERGGSLGRERSLRMIACKKWHVAKRLADRITGATGIVSLHYLFDELATPMPDLGGIESSLEKRRQHRRAVMRLVFEAARSDDLVICVDPANLDVIEDFQTDRATVKVLEIDCEFSDQDLLGHALRIGLAAERSPADTIARLLPTIRNEIRHESDRIAGANLRHFGRIRQSTSAAENAVALAAFLDIPVGKAQMISETDYLFVD
jgi:hypothetical protein